MGAQSERETSVTAATSGSCLSAAPIARESGGLVMATLESAQSGARPVGPPTRMRAGISLSASTGTGTAIGTGAGFTVGGMSAGTVFRRARHKSGRMAVVIVLAFVACCAPHYIQGLIETIGSQSPSSSPSSLGTSNASIPSNDTFDQNQTNQTSNQPLGAESGASNSDSGKDELTDLLEFLALANRCYSLLYSRY